MTPEERKILVDRQVEKSNHFLAQADEMMSLGHSDMAVNRLYYACFSCRSSVVHPKRDKRAYSFRHDYAIQ